MILDKLWRAPNLRRRGALFLFTDGRCTLPTGFPPIISFHMSIITILVGISVQGTSAKRVRVHAFKRVRNGKTELVKAHWRYYRR